VAEHPKSERLHRIYQVLHRGNKVKCIDETVRHGKHQFSLVTVAFGLMDAHKSNTTNNWIEPVSSTPARPSRRAQRAKR
jgi:hypothetical protein